MSVIGYVQPYAFDELRPYYRACGVFFIVNYEGNTEDSRVDIGDVFALDFTDGGSTVDISVTIEGYSRTVSNEYVILEIPMSYANGDYLLMGYQMNRNVKPGMQGNFAGSSVSTYYQHNFTVSGDASVVLKDTVYQPVTAKLEKFMSMTGSASLGQYATIFQDQLLPYMSTPAVYNLALGGAVSGNAAFVSLSSTGLNSIAVGCNMTKQFMPEAIGDFEVPGLSTFIPNGWNTPNKFLDKVYAFTKVDQNVVADE